MPVQCSALQESQVSNYGGTLLEQYVKLKNFLQNCCYYSEYFFFPIRFENQLRTKRLID